MLEIILIAVSLGIIIIYHIYYWYMIKSDPGHTVFGFGKMVRTTWVEKIFSDPKYSLLGVQTMRNEILAGQFLAQSSFIALSVLVGATTAIDLPARLVALTALDPLTGSRDPIIPPVIKLALLIGLLAGVFLNCIQHLRLVKHISMFLGCNTPEDRESLKKSVIKLYSRSIVFFWFAMRCMLLLFPCIAWIFGPTWALVASICSILFMYTVDSVNMGEKTCDITGQPAQNGGHA